MDVETTNEQKKSKRKMTREEKNMRILNEHVRIGEIDFTVI